MPVCYAGAGDNLVMDAAEAGLIGAAIGGGVAILKSWIDGRSQVKLEKAKAEWSKENAVAAELRTHVATVARELFAVQHSIEWLCSKTDENSELSVEDVDRYDTEIHTTFPKLLGALATVSSLNEQAYNDLSVLAFSLFKIDGKIARALRGFSTAVSKMGASAMVANERGEVTRLWRELPVSISRIMKDL
jgi:hypothetical protein